MAHEPEALLPIEPLAEADLPALCALSAASHWNQTADDWRWMLTHGRARGLRRGDRVIASALVLPFEPSVAWISMVLVLPDERRRGHASRLFREALDWLARPDRAQLLPVLDATPAGRTVYVHEGFLDDWEFARWERRGVEPQALRPLDESGVPARRQVGPILASDWPVLLAQDLRVFGADRSALLRELARREPALARVVRSGQRITGYCFGRPGRIAHQLGPVVADDAESTWALVDDALSAVSGDVFIDVPQAAGSDFESALRVRGFALQRPFTRMVRPARAGAVRAPGEPGRVWAVAGPELG